MAGQDPLELLTIDEVASLWQVSKDYVYDLAGKGDLPVLRMGRMLRFRRNDIEAYLERSVSA